MMTRDGQHNPSRREVARWGGAGVLGALAGNLGQGGVGGSRWRREGKSEKHTDGITNVREFGAVGDGVTDDTRSLQDALDAAVEGSGVCYIPPGVYRVSTTLVVEGNVKIQGASNFRDGAVEADIGGSVLYLADSAGCDLMRISNEGRDAFVYPVVLDVALFGNRRNNEAGSGLVLEGMNLSPVVGRCNISHFAEHGISAPSTCNNGLIRGCCIYYNGGNGLNLAGWADGRVIANSCGRNGGQGVSIGAANNQILANHCWLNRDRGIRLASEGNQVVGNRCNDAGGAGIHVVGARQCVVMGNVSDGNGRDANKSDDARSGIRVSGATERCQLIGNVLTGGSEEDGTQRRGISALAGKIVSLSLYGNETSGDHCIEIAVDDAKVRFQFGARGPISATDLVAKGAGRGGRDPMREVSPVSGTGDDATVNGNFSHLARRVGAIEDALGRLGLLEGGSHGR